MASKFFKAFSFIKKKSNASKISPTITQPRQLKKTMEGIRSKYKKFAFKEAKTAKDRANIVRTKKSIERMNKLQKAQDKRKEGIKASKEVKKMIGTGQADRVGSRVYHRGVREKKSEGGLLGPLKKFRNRGLETPPKPKRPAAQSIAPKDQKKLEDKFRKKVRDQENRREPARKDSLREKIMPKKKKDRLKELRKELGMKKGGRAKKFPDLTGDGKVTFADILKGRGVINGKKKKKAI